MAQLYFGIAIQRGLILDRLREAPASVRELETELNVPDATRRVHELRKGGHQITTTTRRVTNPDGTVTDIGLYVLDCANSAQHELFESS